MALTRYWTGLDVGADTSAACVVDDRGTIVFENVGSSAAAELHTHLKPFKRRMEVLGLEAGSFANHLARALKKFGYPVAIFETRQSSKFLSIRRNKTDQNDAYGIAELARIGGNSVSIVHLKNADNQRLRSTLILRRRLVLMRVGAENALRALIRQNGGRLESSSSATALERHVSSELGRLRKKEKIDLREDIEPLLAISLSIRNYVTLLDAKLARLARDTPVCRRFLDIPGVGPICALSFYSVVEDPWRFRRNADVGAYLGMVPRIRQSGQGLKHYRIGKMGDAMTRGLLVTSAILHLKFGRSDLRTWGEALAERIGKPRARMAVARKLAIVMIAMWKSGRSFESAPSLTLHLPVGAAGPETVVQEGL